MAWTTRKQYNFRSTLAYITDPAGSIAIVGRAGAITEKPLPLTYTLDSDASDVGWSTGSSTQGARDRNAANASKGTCGCHFVANAAGSPHILQIELRGGVGSYEIGFASGDPDGVGTTQPYIQIFDGTTLKNTIDGTAGIANFMDATGVNRTAANWDADNQVLTISFADTSGPGGTPVMYIKCGDTATAGFTMINCVSVKKVNTGPNITSVSTATPREGASLTITGTAFGASQGAGNSTINGEGQTETSWADTQVVSTVVLGTLKFGAPYNVVVTDDGGTPSNTYAGITGLLPANSGLSYVDVGAPNTTSAYRLTASADLASGDQIEWDNKGGEVTVASDGTFTAGPGVSSFSFRVWTSGSGYGQSATQLTTLGGGATDRPIIRPFNKRSGLGF